jgi:FlaA1/EpsC-like NDP-sugar epimerase
MSHGPALRVPAEGLSDGGFRERPCLVTGAGGFIGGHLVAACSETEHAFGQWT